MGIGVSIFLIALGLILAFAVNDVEILGLDVNVVGFILAACGVLGLIITLVIFAPRRSNAPAQTYPQNTPPQPQQGNQYPPSTY